MSEKYNVIVIDSEELGSLSQKLLVILEDINCRSKFVESISPISHNDPTTGPDCLLAYNNELSTLPQYLGRPTSETDELDPGAIILLADRPSKNYIANAIRLGVADVIDINRTAETGFKRSIRNVCQKRQLWKGVKKRQQMIQQAHEELKEKNTELLNFYHNVSHELKTPLTSCLEHISIVDEGMAGGLNEKQTEYLEVAIGSCQQMAECINDLLDTNSLNSGTLTVELKETVISELLEEIHQSFLPICSKADIDLRISIDPGLPAVMVDSTRIRQVVGNLIANAIKHTAPKGSIILEVSRHRVDPGAVTVSVSDFGRGIPEGALQKIFNPFYQVNPESSDLETASLGLGLSICKHILELHGSQIEVQSQIGEGSKFMFDLVSSNIVRTH